MKYAILGDIHSNLEALTAVLEDARQTGYDRLVSVGDVVGYNANPVECLDLVRAHAWKVVRGNHDHYCGHDEDLGNFHPLAADAVDWTRSQLSAEQRAYLRGLPLSAQVDHFTLVHSTLDTPDMWGYVFDKLEADANFNYQTTAVCFFGHTHVPLAFEKTDDIRGGLYNTLRVMMGRKYFVNVGSVGQPRDGDPRAAYALYDVERNLIELRRVPYDFTSTQRKILAAGLSERMAARLAIGR